MGQIVLWIVMVCAVLGALAAIRNAEQGLGKEFMQGIYSIGPIFVPVAGIMASIPFLSVAIMTVIGPAFHSVGADPAIAATTIIAVDMGGYQLAQSLAKGDLDNWIMSMVVGYMSGATIIFSIPVGLAMLQKRDHKYMALGIMAGLLSIPIGVATSSLIMAARSLEVRTTISTSDEQEGVSFTSSKELAAGDYRVRVRAMNAKGEPLGNNWSKWLAFTVSPAAPPRAPNVALPKQPRMRGPSFKDTTPTFTWDSVPGADHYQLRLDNVTDKPVPVIPGAIVVPTRRLTLGLMQIMRNLVPLILFVVVLAVGLRFIPEVMIRLFMLFGRFMDAALKLVLVSCIVEHFTQAFSKLLWWWNQNTSWGFDPIIWNEGDFELRALEIAGYIGIMLAGAFPMVYLIQKYLSRPMEFVGRKLGLEAAGAAGLLATVANILAMFRLVKDMRPKDKVLIIAFAVCAAFLFGDHLAFTVNFQPTLVSSIIIGKLTGGLCGFALAYWLSVPKALELERLEQSPPATEDSA